MAVKVLRASALPFFGRSLHKQNEAKETRLAVGLSARCKTSTSQPIIHVVERWKLGHEWKKRKSVSWAVYLTPPRSVLRHSAGATQSLWGGKSTVAKFSALCLRLENRLVDWRDVVRPPLLWCIVFSHCTPVWQAFIRLDIQILALLPLPRTHISLALQCHQIYHT